MGTRKHGRILNNLHVTNTGYLSLTYNFKEWVSVLRLNSSMRPEKTWRVKDSEHSHHAKKVSKKRFVFRILNNLRRP